jgi:hypothetical protein
MRGEKREVVLTWLGEGQGNLVIPIKDIQEEEVHWRGRPTSNLGCPLCDERHPILFMHLKTGPVLNRTHDVKHSSCQVDIASALSTTILLFLCKVT